MSREIIKLDAEEQHELLFRIQVEGNDVSPARVRLVCEGDEMSYMFNGRSSGEEGIVQFALPVMKDKLKEGVYPARVEVLIDNKYFAPVQFDLEFKQPVKVFAEAVRVLPPIAKKPELKVSVEAITVKPVNPGPRPIVVESLPTPPPPPVETTVPTEENAPVEELPVKVEPPVTPVQPSPLPSPSFVETPIEPPAPLPAPLPPVSPSLQVPPQRPVPGSLRAKYQQKRGKNVS